METYIQKSTRHTPEVSFSLSTMTLLFRGHSIPEDVPIFFEPLTTFIDNNLTFIRSSKSNLKIVMQLEYFNSATLKFLVKLFNTLIGIKGKSHIEIDFYYDLEDEDLHETGVDIATVLDIPVNFICKSK